MSVEEINTNISNPDLELILENLSRVVMLIDLDGTILYWNGGGEHVFGYKPEEVMGKPVWFLYDERSEDTFLGELDILKNGNEVSFDAVAHRPDHSRIWLSVTRKMITNSEGEKVILGTASDISLQKELELELSRSRARYEAILETAVEGIITINKKGYIQEVNEAAQDMFGYKAEELKGENISILMPSPYKEEHDRYLERYHNTGEKRIIGIGREVRGQKKDGTIFPIELAVNEVDVGGEVIYSGLIKDITNRRKLENEILNIAEDERRRIGQELHDGLGQMLSAIGLISRNLARKLKANELPGAEEVEEISKMIKEADEQARNMAHGLTYIILENNGLKIAVKQLCEHLQRYTEVSCEFNCTENIEITGRNASLHLYRIVQEALSNAIEHGQATTVLVNLSKKNNYLELSVKDNGVGLTGEEKQFDKGMGIKTMRYRVHIMGGMLSIDTIPGGWTQVFCRIPFTNLTEM